MPVQDGECLLVTRLHGFDELGLIMQNRGWQAATISVN